MMAELIAIITPVYVSPEFPSRLRLFDQCVASVNKLETAHLHIVVDDGSPNAEGIQRVLSKYGDSRIRYLRRKRKKTDLKTASNALNFGIDAVLGGHDKISAVTPLHSDDLMCDVSSRAKALEPDDVGAALGKIVIRRNRKRTIHEPDFDLRPQDYVARGIAPYPVGSIMWKPGTLAGMKAYNKFGGVYNPRFVNVEDVLVAKLTALYLRDAGLRIAVSGEISMVYRHHQDSLRGHHRGSDLWDRNVSSMTRMYYKLLSWDHLNPQ